MKKILRAKTRSRSLKTSLAKIVLQILWGLCLICSLLAIISYHKLDNSWFNYSSANLLPKNWLGLWGANLAAFHFYILGKITYLMPVFLSFLIYLSYYPKAKLRMQWERLVGFVGLFVSSAGLFRQGVIGRYIYSKLILLVDSYVLSLICIVVLLASLTLVLRFSVLLYCYQSLLLVGHKITTNPKIRAVPQQIFAQTIQAFKYISLAIYQVFKASIMWIYRLFFGDQDVGLEQVLFHDYQDLHRPAALHPIDKPAAQFINSYQGAELQANFADNTASASALKAVDLTGDQHDQNLQVKTEHNLARVYKLPDLSIFTALKSSHAPDSTATKQLQKQAKILEEKLKCFNVFGQVVSVEYGPVVSLFEFKPHIESKVSKILALEHDLALALETTSLRIIAPVPGKSVVGFEVANRERRAVYFGDIINAADFEQSKYALPLILGQDTIGKNMTIDLARMPHLLIAGSTGSGKSVALNTMLTSLLCCCTPEQLRLILVDPKRLEFASYEDIPHLLFPIAADPRHVINILRWVVQEMEQRYITLAAAGVKNIDGYHAYCQAQQLPHLPYIAVVIDELADLMMTAGKDVESLIIRIAQKARAAGIHLIVATQRPSVDVITGLIKINFPSRISFRVASKVDSRTILDCMGAEKLLGRGDMLFLDSQSIGLKRVHGAYVSNVEVQQVVTQLLQNGRAQYLNLNQVLTNNDLDGADIDATEALLPEILDFLRETDEISISLLQRRFRIGYNRSARIIDTLESLGYLHQSEAGKPRRVNKHVLRSQGN